ncbi:MAG: hypothetical protein KBD78_13795 [Oligoflexales bacterium]|nr:hypothetical protein [Oligoflexales bacterium]
MLAANFNYRLNVSFFTFICALVLSNSQLTAQTPISDLNYFSKNCRTSGGQEVPCELVGINMDLARETAGHCPSGLGIDTPTPIELKNMNVKWVRQDKGWMDVLGRDLAARDGLSDEQGYEKAYGKLRDFYYQNTKVLLVIHGDYYGSAIRLLHKFGPIIGAWQIANEPDIAISIRPIIPASAYARDLRQGYHEIKRAYVDYYNQIGAVLRPGDIPPVITAGFASKNPYYLQQVINEFRGEALPFDGVATHFYAVNTTNMAHPFPAPFTASTPTIKELLKSYQRVVPNHPIWVTEVGIHQAHLTTDLVKTYMGAAYTDLVNAVQEGVKLSNTFWFAWHNVMPGTFGLVDLCGQRKWQDYNQFWGIATGVQPK